jgi:aldose 1-epimerase
MDAARSPSGRQHRLSYGSQRATVVQVGGGLREYEVGGFPVLHGYGAEEMAGAGKGQVLAPWPNRLADGRYEFDGMTPQLPLSEPERRNAIHGLVRWNAWKALEASGSRLRMGHLLWPQPGYPFTLGLELEYSLTEAGLAVTMRAENLGRRPAPYGAGFHPYVRAELGVIDGSVLQVPAETWLQTDSRLIPTGRLLAVEGTDRDFRSPRPLGSTSLDTAFTDLERGAGELARVTLASGDGSRHVTVWMDGAFDYLMIFTSDTLHEPEHRRGLGVEPMTCAPDAFNNGLGLRVLEPGEHTFASWGIEVSQDS